MSTTPTNNPIPSESPKDLAFNAGKIDEFVNSPEEAFSDRFGLARLTIAGIEKEADQAILSIGFIPVDSFEAGATLTVRNQSLHYVADNNYYRWDGALPKVVPAASTPASTGGVASGAWVNVTDNTLRSNLAAPTGAGLVGFDSSSSYLSGTVGYFIKNSVLTSIYAGTMPLSGQQATFATTNLLADIVSSSMMVVSGGAGIMQNSNNPLKEFTFVVKDSQAVIQTGDNAVDISGMPYTLTIFHKA